MGITVWNRLQECNLYGFFHNSIAKESICSNELLYQSCSYLCHPT